MAGKDSMKKRKIVLTVIKESDGRFGVLGHPEKHPLELITTQADSWEELKVNAVEKVNAFLKEKDQPPISLTEIDFSFDLPSFLDNYPQLTATALAQQAEKRKSLLKERTAGHKKVTNSQTDQILAALKQLDGKSPQSKTKKFDMAKKQG